MRTHLLFTAALLSSVAASPVEVSHLLQRISETHELLRRVGALSSSPSGNYAPSVKQSSCPSNIVRQPTAQNASSGIISSLESDYVTQRRANAVSAWTSYLNNGALGLTDFDVSAFLANTSNLPNVGIAASGGGYRAMLSAAGVYNAFDSRNSTSVSQGTGGILQLATYMAGLSGGSWFTGSLAINDLPTIWQMQSFWDLSTNLVEPGGVISLVKYYDGIQDEIDDKNHAGNFDLSLTDYWGAALSRHLVNATNDGDAVLFSSIQNLSTFTSHQMPFPIIIADSRSVGEGLIPVNTTIYEFTPFEFGSWNPSLQAFIPMEYLGTQAVNGSVNGTNGCVVGYDNAGFIMGTSATLFNTILYTLFNGNSTLDDILGDLLTDILGKDNDIATYPNPFTGLNPGKYKFSNSTEIDLVDGGEDDENVPIWPLIHPDRNVDVVFALDASADTNFNWPNGSSLVYTRQRMADPEFQQLGHFPNVPSDQNTFTNRGLNNRTTFFGCNESSPTPLVIYMPNHPYTSYTNFSTFTLEYSNAESTAFIDNGMHVASGNLTSIAANTPTLPTCLACALIQRAVARTNTTWSSQCQSCFSAYCWDGVSDSSTPNGEFWPSIPGETSKEQDGSGAGQSGDSGNAARSAREMGMGGIVIAGLITLGALVL